MTMRISVKLKTKCATFHYVEPLVKMNIDGLATFLTIEEALVIHEGLTAVLHDIKTIIKEASESDVRKNDLQ